jgi:ADP-heptose:LPS heptosyltransferase
MTPEGQVLRGLFIRLDKIGDLCLTLPADEGARSQGHEIHWLISSGLGFVTHHAVPPREATQLSRSFSWSGLVGFVHLVRRLRPDYSISFFAPWWIHLGLWLGGVPMRYGVRSRWDSYLFLNHGLRQRRSQSTQSELKNNCDLASWALSHFRREQVNSQASPLVLSAPGPIPSLVTSPYLVVHPGMAGSARNWAIENYAELIEKLTDHITVVITGTATDREVLEPLKARLKASERVLWWNERLTAEELLAALGRAAVVVAPSTGVLHLAAALGRPTVGLYSPVFVQHPRRWGAQSDLAENLLPTGFDTETGDPRAHCPGHFGCLGTKCPVYDCMQDLKVARVLSVVRAQMSRGGSA